MTAKADPSEVLGPFDAAGKLGDELATAPLALRLVAAVAMTGVASVLAIAFDSMVSVPNLSLVFVIPVVVAAVSLGLVPSLAAAVLGAVAYNFFFTTPYYTLAVDDPANIWAIGLLFVVGCIASAVASTSRRRAEEAALRRRQAGVLQACGHAIARSETAGEAAGAAADALHILFQVPVAVIMPLDDGVDIIASRGAPEIGEAEADAARHVAGTRQGLPAGVYPADRSRLDLFPVATRGGPSPVIGLALDPDERPADPATLVDLVGSLLALALESRAPFSAGQTAARSR
jgi:K+-sensing histidine kinase KdpD